MTDSNINYDFLDDFLPDEVNPDLTCDDLMKMISIANTHKEEGDSHTPEKNHDFSVTDETLIPPSSHAAPAKNIVSFTECDWDIFDKEMCKLGDADYEKITQLDADYELIITDFRMREIARGRKPILFKVFKDAVPDLDDREKGLKFLADNPTFIDQFKENIAQNNRRQKWVERKKGEKRQRERDGQKENQNQNQNENEDEDEGAMVKLAREIVQKSLE